MIFFHDKHWYHSEPLFSVEEEDEDEEEEEEEELEEEVVATTTLTALRSDRAVSPSPSQVTVTSAGKPTKKPEYEFLLFNYLLRFVHREGHIGEFARAGVLFLIDVAVSPPDVDSQSIPEPSTLDSDPADDAAMSLAEYILDGDFSDVLAAGLGAVYSSLPTKLAFFPDVPTDGTGNAMKIGATTTAVEEEKEKLLELKERSRELGIEDARSVEFKAKMDHFLTLLVFLQDVLRRNVENEVVNSSGAGGASIAHAILDAVRRIFLENIFYPTILECSDADGSSVAIMSYIEIMIRSLRDGPLANLLVGFLLTEDNDDAKGSKLKERPTMLTAIRHDGAPPSAMDEKKKKHRRRQSSAMILLEMEAPESRKQSEYFTSSRFTLKDLLLTNLRSKSSPAATTALQLIRTLLTHHPQLSIDKLLLVIPDSQATSFPHPCILHPPTHNGQQSVIEEEDEDFDFSSGDDLIEDPVFLQPDTTYSTHEREMGLYLALVTRVDPSYTGDNFSTGYDHYLHDALSTIQSQPVYWQAIEDGIEATDSSRSKHRLNLNDPVISLVLEKLTTFFFNSPEFNVGLTGVLASLAMHPDRSLAGWLTFGVNDDVTAPNSAFDGRELGEDGDDRSIDFSIEERLSNATGFLPAASLDERSRPVLHTIFHGLISQLERYRQQIGSFDKFLLERRQGLLFSENLTDALNLALDLRDDPKSPNLKPPSAALGAAAEVPKPKPKPKSTTSSFVSFLSPRRTKPAKPTPPPEPASPPEGSRTGTVSANPFGSHYQETNTIKVDPLVADVPSTAPWSTAKKGKLSGLGDDDMFGASAWGDSSSSRRNSKVQEREEEAEADEEEKQPTSVTLSQLLDNVVILEESIKELVAIMHARRSLGIDSLRYL